MEMAERGTRWGILGTGNIALSLAKIESTYCRKIWLDLGYAAVFWMVLRSFSGKLDMAMSGLSSVGILCGES